MGASLLVDGIGGIVVETEAYDQLDPASHCFCGPTSRNAAMFGPPGWAYIYRSYGLHWCLNFVCGAEGTGSAVLIRALEPCVGLAIMAARRGIEDARRLCAGPGRLTQALGIDMGLNGAALDAPPFRFQQSNKIVRSIAGRRIGIKLAMETPWQFGPAASPFLSRAFPEENAGRSFGTATS